MGTFTDIIQWIIKYEQSGGLFSALFKPEYFSRDQPLAAGDKAIQMMAIWALLLNRLDLVKLFCAYSSEPIALSIVMAKIARSMARRTREWCLVYEKGLLELSCFLNAMAVHLLDAVYRESPTKAYQALCRRLGASFNGMTLPQLAYECRHLLFFVLHR